MKELLFKEASYNIITLLDDNKQQVIDYTETAQQIKTTIDQYVLGNIDEVVLIITNVMIKNSKQMENELTKLGMSVRTVSSVICLSYAFQLELKINGIKTYLTCELGSSSMSISVFHWKHRFIEDFMQDYTSDVGSYLIDKYLVEFCFKQLESIQVS